MAGMSITRQYDGFLRCSGLSVTGGTPFSQGYGYDAASRLASATEGAESAAYGYVANSNLIQSITFQNSGNTVMTTAKGYDALDRLASISESGSQSFSGSYTYNAANQRTQYTIGDGSYPSRLAAPSMISSPGINSPAFTTTKSPIQERKHRHRHHNRRNRSILIHPIPRCPHIVQQRIRRHHPRREQHSQPYP